METSKVNESKAALENQCTNISKLPDAMIHEILEKLPLEETMKTGSLAKRWRNLWKYRTNIEIGSAWVKSTGKEIVPSINNLVRFHLGKKIKRFSIKFMYHSSMSTHVDSWVQFATDKEVENLEMNLDVNYTEMRSTIRKMPSYELNPCLFDCNSLVVLKLRCCILALPISTSLTNLKEIYLQQMELDNSIVYTLTSNTPVLEVLSMKDCNNHSDLHINMAENPHFKRLSVCEGWVVNPQTQMHVTAPTIKEFLFNGGLLPRTSYSINISCQCTKVTLLLDIVFRWCVEQVRQEMGVQLEARREDNYRISNWVTQEMEQKFLYILGCFDKVESLAVNNWSVQIFSISAMRNIERITFSCKHLTQYTNFQKRELPSICFMLRACSELEEITFATSPSDDEDEPLNLYLVEGDFDEEEYIEHMKSVLELPKLKTLVAHINEANDTTEVDEFVYGFMILLSAVAENLKQYVIYRNKIRYVLDMTDN